MCSRLRKKTFQFQKATTLVFHKHCKHYILGNQQKKLQFNSIHEKKSIRLISKLNCGMDMHIEAHVSFVMFIRFVKIIIATRTEKAEKDFKAPNESHNGNDRYT